MPAFDPKRPLPTEQSDAGGESYIACQPEAGVHDYATCRLLEVISAKHVHIACITAAFRQIADNPSGITSATKETAGKQARARSNGTGHAVRVKVGAGVGVGV